MQPLDAITEEELHAYVDGALDPGRRLDVALHLASSPFEAARVEAFRAQKEAIRTLFDHIVDQPTPKRLRRVVLRHVRRTRLRRYVLAMAAAGMGGIILLAGGALGARLALLQGVIAGPAAQQQTAGKSYPVIRPPPQPRMRGSLDI